MTEKRKKTGEATDAEASAQDAGATKLTEESLSSVAGGVSESRLKVKKKSIVQAYPAVEYD